jgi:hypothetical protein
MTPNPDNNPDKVSGFGGWPGTRLGIPTIIPTKCRDSQGAGQTAWNPAKDRDPDVLSDILSGCGFLQSRLILKG